MAQDFSKRTELPLTHLFDGTALNVYDKNVINLSAGAPGPNLLKECCRIFQTATEHRMKYELVNNAYLFQYGPTVGIHDARVEIAKFLSDGYKDEVKSAELVLTSGATHGLHLILSTLLDMTATIFVDEVTYMIALEAFAQFSGMQIVAVPLTEHGVDISALKAAINLHKHKSKSTGKLFWGCYYAIPTFHNPTGILFSPETCRQLIQLARAEDILIACDDVYNLICYDEQVGSPKRLFAYDNDSETDFKGNVISNGSFSKILSPGIRMGWMECPPRITELFRDCGVLKSGGAANNYMSGIISSMIQLGLAQKQLLLYVEKYKERMIAVCDVLDQHLPKTCSFLRPTGGYFIWIKFPVAFDAVEFNSYCLKNYRVVAIAGSRFSATKEFKNYMRITIAFHEKTVLQGAVKTLCEAILAYEKL